MAAIFNERGQWMIVGIVEGLALVFHDERAKVHLVRNAAVFAAGRARGLVQLFDFRLDGQYVSALDLAHFHLVTVQYERRHGRHALAGGRFRALVDVHFEEHRAVVFVRQFVVQRRDASARAAPRGRKVHDHQLHAVGVQLFLKLRVVRQLFDDHTCALPVYGDDDDNNGPV